MKVCLTFDVESDFSLGRSFRNIDDSLPLIADFLDDEKIKATFFVSGKSLEKRGEKVMEVCKSHEIGSHGYRHRKLVEMKRGELEEEVKKSKRVFSDIGVKVRGFRAPKLVVNEDVLDTVAEYYDYDSSIVPSVMPFRYFNFFKNRAPHMINDDLMEIPVGTVNVIRMPTTSSWYFLFGERFLDFIKTFNLPEVCIFLFHSFDMVHYNKPSNLPFYKYSLYYSKCSSSKIKFLEKLVNLLKPKSEFVTCGQIYEKYSQS